MAARHFSETLAVVAAAGGFQPTLWTLSRDDPATRTSARPTTGTSDGYWRTHVILAADESPASDGEGYAVDADTLRESAGVWVEGETRAVEVGRVLVVNDHLRRRWYHRGTIEGSAGKDQREGSSVGAVVLTFDVMRPEYAACRASYVRHKARLVREAGERNAGERTWRSLALAALGNLS